MVVMDKAGDLFEERRKDSRRKSDVNVLEERRKKERRKKDINEGGRKNK